MQDPQTPGDVPVVEIKKPLLKKPKWKKRKFKRYACREDFLADHDKGSVKVYNERLQAGLMIFPHEREYKDHEPSKGFAVCPYELVAGKIKWKPRVFFGLKKEYKKPFFVYDMIHIAEEDARKFLGALAYIAGLTPRRPDREQKPGGAAKTLSEIDQRVMKFRL